MQNDVKQVDRDAMVRFSRLQCPSVFAAHRIASTTALQAENERLRVEAKPLRDTGYHQTAALVTKAADALDAKDKRIAELEGERDAIHEAAGNVYKYHMAAQGEWPDALEDVLSPLWVLLVQRENMKEPTQ